VVLLDGAGGVVAHNRAARGVFGAALEDPAADCCGLVGCGSGPSTRPLSHHCVTAAVLEHGRPLTDLEGTLGDRRPIDITAVPLAAGVMLQVRTRTYDPGAPPQAPPPLRITTLGPVALECEGGSLGGAWLHHRPGALLKYLICARWHRVPVEELADALWPQAGRAGVTSLRQAVHTLRERLEPNRPDQAPSRFVIAGAGAYELAPEHVVVDADEFETRALAALVTVERAGGLAAEAQLAQAAELYTGDFLADDPYAEWALAERDRLRSLVARVLRALADLHLEAGELAPASTALHRLADLEPLDVTNQRDLISLMLRQDQHAAAARRYDTMRRKFKRAFDMEPRFTLADLLPQGTLQP